MIAMAIYKKQSGDESLTEFIGQIVLENGKFWGVRFDGAGEGGRW